MKDKIYQFMQGRYGQDQLNRFLMVMMAISWILSWFAEDIFYEIPFILLIVIYLRTFSKNTYKRAAENFTYMKYYNKFFGKKAPYHIYRCPSCKQKIRVPKGKGKISITCPNCRNQFVKRS